MIARIRFLVRAGNPILGRKVRRFLRRKSYPQSEPLVNRARTRLLLNLEQIPAAWA